MELTRGDVLDWLAANHRTLKWLAAQCEVTPAAVSNWLKRKNPRPIPAAKRIIISRLMEEDRAKQAAKPPHNLVLEFDDSAYQPIEQAALGAGLTIREWASKTLNEIAGEDVHEMARKIGERLKTYDFKPRAEAVAEPAHIMAAAGPGISAEVIDWNEGDEVVRVRICGTSMEPTLTEGQIVEMRHKTASRSPFMKKGVIYLVQLDGDWMVKRYANRNPRPEEVDADFLTSSGMVGVLRSDNPAFSDIDITRPFEWAAWMDEPEPNKEQ